MIERLKNFIERRRENKAKRLVLPAAFWGHAHEFGAAFVLAIGDRRISKEEFSLLAQKWAELLIIARNAHEVDYE